MWYCREVYESNEAENFWPTFSDDITLLSLLSSQLPMFSGDIASAALLYTDTKREHSVSTSVHGNDTVSYAKIFIRTKQLAPCAPQSVHRSLVNLCIEIREAGVDRSIGRSMSTRPSNLSQTAHLSNGTIDHHQHHTTVNLSSW